MSRFNSWPGSWINFSLFACITRFALCLTLASCAFTPDEQAPFSQPDWEISGKIGIKENAIRASSSLFQWRQQDDQYIIYLFNALGQTQLTLTGNKRYAKIQKPDGETATAETPEELLEQVTGWHFPIHSARYWLQGKTEGNEQNIIRSSDGLLNTFNTAQWQASLEQYKPVAGKLLPHKIILQHNDLKITLIIKEHARFTP